VVDQRLRLCLHSTISFQDWGGEGSGTAGVWGESDWGEVGLKKEKKFLTYPSRANGKILYNIKNMRGGKSCGMEAD